VASLGKIGLVFVVALTAGAPVGYALAQSGGSDEGAGTSAYPAAVPADPSALPSGVVLRPDIAERSSPEASHDDLNWIGSAPPPQRLIQECRADYNAESDCGIVLSMADSKLTPGEYSDQELQAAVEAAGYSWSP
jgi:hypothetical protein